MRAVRLVLVMTAALAGCTTITRGPGQDLSIKSTPAGATITVDGVDRGVTPSVVPIEGNRNHFLTLTKECHETQSIALKRDFGFAMWFFGNLLFPGVGHVVDVASGAAWRSYPQKVDVPLAQREGCRT